MCRRRDRRVLYVTETLCLTPYTAFGRRTPPRDLPPDLVRAMPMKEVVLSGDHPPSVPMLALGGGVTLAATLNVLRHTGIPTYALCPSTDFVRHSRWYQPLPTALPNPQPADLEEIGRA